MLPVFGFQDVIKVVTIGDVEPGRNVTEEQRLIFKHKTRFLIYQCVNSKIFNKISNASTSKEAWEILVKTYGDGEKKKKVKLQTLRRQYELLEMEGSESIANYFDRILELINVMRVCMVKVTYQQVVDKILRTLPPEFDYVVVAIKELKDQDIMEVKELQHSLEVHAPIRNTKIKNLVKLVNPLKKGGQTKHKSKTATPKTARSGSAKNKPNNCAHLAQDEGTDSDFEAVVLLAITSNDTQPRIPIEEEEKRLSYTTSAIRRLLQQRISIEEKELIAAPVFNKASVIRRPLHLKDQELFQDSAVNSEGELIHLALIAEAELVEFDRAAIEEKWLKAMKEEINSIKKNQTWELLDPPSNKKPIALKLVYKVKGNPRGEVVKNKTKLVAKGFLHKVGIDYGEVYAPVARIVTIVIAINVGWSMHQLDVKSALLNSPFEEEPLGFVVKGKENKVYKLKKALYGLK
ncbi:hypothetical protein CR513_01260, partial [Mucuna pruriens]